MIQTENAEDLMGELGDLLLEEDDVAESANDLRRWPINWGITSLVGTLGRRVETSSGTTDCMRFLVGASGADDVEIVAFLKADYDAGLRATANRQGTTATGTDGRWVAPLMLDAGTYRILGNKDGYEVSSFEIVVP
jgi:hypothetical protein